MDEDSRRLAAICAIAKNEGPYIAEWAIYHRLVGFDHILVYDNESTDDTRAVLEVLAEAGLVSWLEWPSRSDGQTQKTAYADGLARLRPNFEWITFIDIDEFLFIPAHDNSIAAFLGAYAQLDAIAVNWSMFGTSGHLTKTPGLVIERFTYRAHAEHTANRAVKTIARTRTLLTPNLHNHEFTEGVSYRTVTGEVIAHNTGRSESVNHDVILINHYFTKSVEEWQAKVARGRATKPDTHPDKFRKEEHFRRNDKNDVKDLRLVAYATQIHEKMRELGLEG
jgi:hypothetical protein